MRKQWKFEKNKDNEEEILLKNNTGKLVMKKGDPEYNGMYIDIRIEKGSEVFDIPLVTIENNVTKGKEKDINIYLYGDTLNESYSDKFTITEDELEEAVKSLIENKQMKIEYTEYIYADAMDAIRGNNNTNRINELLMESLEQHDYLWDILDEILTKEEKNKVNKMEIVDVIKYCKYKEDEIYVDNEESDFREGIIAYGVPLVVNVEELRKALK